MSVQVEYLIEGKFTINTFLDHGVSIESIKKVEETLNLRVNSRNEKLYFVGFFELENKIFISFPKSLSIELLDIASAHKLLSLFRKISKNLNVTNRIPDNSFLRKSHNIENLSRLTLADFIISDFLKYGDITFKTSNDILNSDHEPNWVKTIEKIIPITSGSSHVYDRWLTTKRASKYDHLIKSIHNNILNECIDKYAHILGITDHKTIKPNNIRYGIPKNAIQIINAKLREVYVQRDVLVLKALKNWLEKDKDSSIFEFYGTQYFHVIWEEVCSYLLNNNKINEVWSSAFKNPLWEFYDTGKINQSDSFEVDIICENIESKLILADAKYYDITVRNRGILGVSDLSKQINYETQLIRAPAFIEKYRSKDNLINIFIFPAEYPEFQCNILCRIEFPRLHDKNLYGVTFDTMSSFQRYCLNDPLSSLEIRGFFDHLN